MNQTIMAVGAHADDVEIYFGGTLLKYRDRGYAVVYVQSTNNMSGPVREVQADGSLTSTAYPPQVTMTYRKAECAAAADMFDATPIHLDHPQRHYSTGTQPDVAGRTEHEVRYGCPCPDAVPGDVPTILTAHEDEASVQRVADLIGESDAEVIFTHGFVEKNLEHTATALLVIKAYWKAVAAGYGGSLLHAVNRFEGLGGFNCQWETWIDVSDHVDGRMEAVQRHVSQYPPSFERGGRYWRSVLEARGRACGAGAVEAFNFVNPVEPTPNDGELLAELLRNRAPAGAAWRTVLSAEPGEAARH